MKHRLVWGAVTNWFAFAATLGVGFFMMPYLVRVLGNGPYGVWSFVESLLAYFTLFDLGIAACVVRFVAKYHTTGDRDELNHLVSTCLALFVGLGALVALAGGALLPFVFRGLQTAGLPRDEVLAFALLMLSNLAVTLPLSVFPSILDGLEKFAVKSLWRVVVLAARTGATLVVMMNWPSLLNLGIVLTATNLVEHAGFVVLTRWYLPELRLRRRFVNRATLHRVKGYSLHAFLAMVAGRVTFQCGALIVGAMLGAAPVTFFALALRLVEFAKALLRTATNTLTPAVSSLEAAGNMAAIRRMLLVGTRCVLYLILPVQLGLMIFGDPFLDVWMKSTEYADRSYPALVVLSSVLALVVAQSVAARILYGVGKLKWFARIALVEAGVNVVLSVVLCQWYGILGVAIGITVPNLFMNIWVLAYALRYLDVSWGTYLRESWCRPLVAALVLPIMWLIPAWPINGWLMLGAALGTGLVPYAVLVVLLEDKGPWLWRLTRRPSRTWLWIPRT